MDQDDQSPRANANTFENSAQNIDSHHDEPTEKPLRPSGPPSQYLSHKKYANGAKPITRNRASYSCHACRRRKVKCDKVHPVCGNCGKTGDKCTYDAIPAKAEKPSPQHSGTEERHGVKRRRKTLEGSKDTPPLNALGRTDDATGEPRSIEERLDFLTNMVERLSRNSAGQLDDSLDEMSRDGSIFMEMYGPMQKGKAEKAKARRKLGGSKSRSDSVEGTAESSRPDSPSSNDMRTTNEAGDPVAALNLGHLSLQDGGRSRYVGTTFWAYVSDEIDQLNQLLRDQNRCVSPEAPAHSYEDPVKETNSRANQPQSSNDPNSFRKESQPQSRTSNGFTKSMLFQTEDSPLSNFDDLHSEMFENMPTKRQSHVLYRCFMSGVHIISPIIHPPSVLDQYHAFWNWYDRRHESTDNCPDPSFVPLLYAIWYGGSVSISIKGIKKEFGDTTRATLSARLHDEVTRCLTLVSFPRNPSISGLAAFLIVQTILAREEEPLTSSLFIGLALRVAQMMGLHRDPEQFGLPPFQAEARRRMWWHIVHMDGVVALSSGLPPLVSDESYWDVRDISEVKDARLGTPEADQYERDIAAGKRKPDVPDDPLARDRPSMVDVSYVAARGKHVMARLTRKILRLQLGTRPLTRKDMGYLRSCLNDAERQLNHIVNRIPSRGVPEMGFDPSAKNYNHHPFEYDPALATNPTTEELNQFSGISPVGGLNNYTVDYHFNNLKAFHKWARILLSLFIDKAYCVAYQPFLKNVKSKIWPSARQCALRHCHGFMKKFIALATDPAFQSFQWSWPGNHQPMHATMIMLIDLYERPNSTEAARSRAFIDQVFSLSGPDGGVVGGEDGVSVQRPLREGGREAWTMLRRLREKAWQKAGLDPALLWTEQDQIEAGVAKPLTEQELLMRDLREGSLTSAALEGKIDSAELKRLNSGSGDDRDSTNDPGQMPKPSLAHGLYALIKASQKQVEEDMDASERKSSYQPIRPNKRKSSLKSSRSMETGSRGETQSPPQTLSPVTASGTANQAAQSTQMLGTVPAPANKTENTNWGIFDPITNLWSDAPTSYSTASMNSRAKSQSHMGASIPQPTIDGTIPFVNEQPSRSSTSAMPPYLPHPTQMTHDQTQDQSQQDPTTQSLYQFQPDIPQLPHHQPQQQQQQMFDSLHPVVVDAAATTTSPTSTIAHSLPSPITADTNMASPTTVTTSTALPVTMHHANMNVPTSTTHPTTAINSNTNANTTSNTNPNNVNFDWDQWDAVFGQYVMPLDDYMNMDLDDQGGFIS